MKSVATKIAGDAYEIVFKEKVSETAKNFIKNLTYVAVGFGLSYLCLFFFQIAMGRILGPIGYGKYVLIQSIAMFLYIPMNLGMSTALIKYNAESVDRMRQSSIISTTYFFICMISACFFLFYLVWSHIFANVFNVSPSIFFLVIFFALFYNLYVLANSTFRSLHKMKALSILQAMYGFLVLCLPLLLLFYRTLSFTLVVVTTCLSYGIIFFIATFQLRGYLLRAFNLSWFKQLIRYGAYATISGVSSVFLFDFSNIMVNKYLPANSLGIYNAYYFSSIGIVSAVLTIFVTIFFPVASKYQQKNIIFLKIKKTLPYVIFIGLPLLFMLGLLVVTLYGSQYPINYPLMALFALSGVLILVYGLYDWTFCSDGKKGIRLVTYATVIVAVCNVMLSIYCIPLFGLYGAVGAIAFSYLVGIVCLLVFKKQIA